MIKNQNLVMGNTPVCLSVHMYEKFRLDNDPYLLLVRNTCINKYMEHHTLYINLVCIFWIFSSNITLGTGHYLEKFRVGNEIFLKKFFATTTAFIINLDYPSKMQ